MKTPDVMREFDERFELVVDADGNRTMNSYMGQSPRLL